jgi:hypothetical protein
MAPFASAKISPPKACPAKIRAYVAERRVHPKPSKTPSLEGSPLGHPLHIVVLHECRIESS